ncbi:MAG: alpha/beta fold hydrolase [Saprospiraceae bacterium]|nr:alpha/beta fold hydrolase [Saprospiraceae bacterium]
MDYKPNFFFRNGHFNSIYPTIFRKQEDPAFDRVTLDTPDEDFIDIDIKRADGSSRVVILCHGLEGSSDSHYIKGTAARAVSKGWNVVAMNYRSCSGRMNNTLRMYHSGATDDLDLVVGYCKRNFKTIALIGFSLGGNLVMKYTGERGQSLDADIVSLVAISVPTDLSAGSKNIGRRSNFLYENKFLISLKAKLKEKHAQFPNELNINPLKRISKLYDFDDIYTARIHGFKDAEDYYTKCSCAQFIPDIKVPGLIINALDDPFLPEECYPKEWVRKNENIDLWLPKYGGHVGFVMPGQEFYWSEIKAIDFISQHS